MKPREMPGWKGLATRFFELSTDPARLEGRTPEKIGS